MSPNASRADHPTGGFGAGGAINTISGTILEEGSVGYGLRFDYVNFDRFTDAELLAFAANGQEADSTDYAVGAFFSAAYGWSDNVTVALRLPYFFMNDIREVEGGVVENEGDTAGIGDLAILGYFRLLSRQNDTLVVSAIAGLETPTGRTDDLTRAGERFETDHQPGSGSWDPIVGLAMTKSWERWSFHANGLYQINTEGAQDTRLGDIVGYNAALVYRIGGDEHDHEGDHDHDADGMPSGHEHDSHVHGVLYHPPASEEVGHLHENGCGCHHHHHGPSLDLIAEINGVWSGKNVIAGERDDDSGINVVYFSPGCRLTLCGGWSIYFSGGIPITQQPNGAEHRVDYRLILGTSVSY